MDALPVEFNPPRGFIATANAMNLPADYPIAERRVGFEWTAPWRARRLNEVLRTQPHHSLADSLALQRDYTSVLARELIQRLPAGDSPAIAMLRGWDAALRPDSAAAALYVLWYYRHLDPALARWAAPPDAIALIEPLDSLAVLDLLDAHEAELGTLLTTTLAAAWQEAITLLGPDPTTWQWGTLHQIAFKHPLLARLSPADAEHYALPSYARGGSGETPNNTTFEGNDFTVSEGASWRMVVDVGRWDAAQMTNAPGQSGDPRSPFYANLLEGWATDGSFPLLYSKAAIDRHLRMIIQLVPD
jgi:penicillin amidase